MICLFRNFPKQVPDLSALSSDVNTSVELSFHELFNREREALSTRAKARLYVIADRVHCHECSIKFKYSLASLDTRNVPTLRILVDAMQTVPTWHPTKILKRSDRTGSRTNPKQIPRYECRIRREGSSSKRISGEFSANKRLEAYSLDTRNVKTLRIPIYVIQTIPTWHSTKVLKR